MKITVVGGGLAGLSAALELVDTGHEVTLYEARPTLGGAVQTLPRREGDPEPPPDNGQHIALGCFTEYLRFLDRIGEGRSVRRLKLALPVIDERGRRAEIRRSPAALLRYRHVSVGERLAIMRALARWGAEPRPEVRASFADPVEKAQVLGEAAERDVLPVVGRRLGVALALGQRLHGTAERRPRLEQRHRGTRIDQVEGGGQACQPAADHSDSHRTRPRATTASFAGAESRHERPKTSNPLASIRSSWPR